MGPVDHRSGQQAKRQARHKKPEKEALGDLSAQEPQRLYKCGVKNRKPVKDDSDGEEKIQERSNNNPPPVKDTR